MSILKTNQITDLGGNNIISSNGSGTFTQTFASNSPSFYVRLSSNFDLTNDTFVKVPWDTEEFDTDSAFASNKFTVPSGKGGKYFFLVHAFMGNQLGLYNIKLYKNGSAISPNTNFAHQNRSSSDADMSQISIQVQDLSAGDYIEVYIQTTAGSNGDVLSSTSFFQGFKLTWHQL